MLGDKYEVAKKVNIKLVNHRWLEDWYFKTTFPDLIESQNVNRIAYVLIHLFIISA
jgi:hypothetical protein